MKNILVVDDNTDILEAVSTLLHERVKGCAVSIATDGAQGEAIMKSTPVDLVLTDLSMPVMNGYMLIERVSKKKISCSPDMRHDRRLFPGGHHQATCNGGRMLDREAVQVREAGTDDRRGTRPPV